MKQAVLIIELGHVKTNVEFNRILFILSTTKCLLKEEWGLAEKYYGLVLNFLSVSVT